MSITLSVNIAHQKVLLVGAGHLALKKAHYFLAQQAIVSVVAPTCLPAFLALPLHYEKKAYHPSDLQGIFLVYAASNHPSLNQQIMQDAQAIGVIALCAQQGNQLFHAMAMIETEDIMLAAGTHGRYPAMNQWMLQRFSAIYEQEFKEKLEVLQAIRIYLLQSEQKQIASAWLKRLPTFSLYQLHALLHAFQQQRGWVFVFHGVKNTKVIEKDIVPFLETAAQKLSSPCLFAYLSQPVLQQVNQTSEQVFSLSALCELLALGQVSLHVYPMLFQKGRFYDQILQIVHSYPAVLHSLPFADLESVQHLVDLLQQAYGKTDHSLLILYHSNAHGQLSQFFKSVTLEPDTWIMQENQLSCLSSKPLRKQIIVYSLYMLDGYHKHKDAAALCASFPLHTWEFIEHSFLQDAIMQPFLLPTLSYKSLETDAR